MNCDKCEKQICKGDETPEENQVVIGNVEYTFCVSCVKKVSKLVTEFIWKL